jgi:Papain fold toxin 1, glutamine deamidase
MTGIEGTAAPTDGGESSQAMEAGVDYRVDHSPAYERPETIDGSLEDLPAAQSSYRDRPLSEFRAAHEGEFTRVQSETYRVDRFAEPAEVVRNINPEFSDPSGRYQVNCADCSRSVERTWRGDHEEAAGRETQYDSSGVAFEGELPKETEEWAGEKFTETPDSEELRERLEDAGHGSSAIVNSFWEFDGRPEGHAYNVVNYHGDLRVLDGQTGTSSAWVPDRIHPEVGDNRSHTAMAWNADRERIW